MSSRCTCYGNAAREEAGHPQRQPQQRGTLHDLDTRDAIAVAEMVTAFRVSLNAYAGVHENDAQCHMWIYL